MWDLFRTFDKSGDVLGKTHFIRDKLQIDRFGYVGLPLRCCRKHRTVIGVDLRLCHKGVGDGQHGGHKKGQGKQG